MREQKMRALPKNKKIIALVVCFCMAVTLTLTSCGGDMTDETVKKELERLLPASYELNEILWGKGLPYIDSESNDRYILAAEECGYKTTEEILADVGEIFSSEYTAIIKDAIFTDSEDIDPRYLDVNGKLKVDTSNKGFDIKGNVVVESAVIKRQNKTTVVVEAEYADGGKTEIILQKENGKWYLNSPTY